MTRDSRIVETEHGRWRALEACRGRGGVGLLYFLPLADDQPADRPGDDRRASLEPDERLEGLDEGELRRRLDAGTRLTATERRFRAPDGDLWLAQNVGPVWAGRGVAEGLTGVVFTALEGVERRVAGDGGHVGEVDEAELVALWRSAVGADGRGPDAPETGS